MSCVWCEHDMLGFETSGAAQVLFVKPVCVSLLKHYSKYWIRYLIKITERFAKFLTNNFFFTLRSILLASNLSDEFSSPSAKRSSRKKILNLRWKFSFLISRCDSS